MEKRPKSTDDLLYINRAEQLLEKLSSGKETYQRHG